MRRFPRAALITLANRRDMPPTSLRAAAARLLHGWYRAGYVDIFDIDI